MQTQTAPAASPFEGIFSGRVGAFVPFVIYVAFAVLVYALQGPEPSLSIDHISYFKLADEIRQEYPAGDYYRTINSVRFYSVLLAYLFDYTGSHVASLKLLLVVLTVGYLLAFQLLMGLLTKSRAEAVLFALLSSLFVSFGASIWGVTDFAASLNRTIVIPFVVLLAWFFFRFFHSGWRYAIYPALVLLSLMHLSALHVALVFAAFEVLDFAFRRRLRATRDLLYLFIAFLASIGVQAAIELTGAGTSSFIRYTLFVAMPNIPVPPPPDLRKDQAHRPPPPKLEAPLPAVVGAAPAAEPGSGPSNVPSARHIPVAPNKLSIQHAWDIELFAFPWRNMPPTLPTLATIAMSYGAILLLAVLGALRAWRTGAVTSLDRLMAAFAAGVILAAYGLQTVLWALRGWVNVFPVNFEEIRAVNMLMLPSVYFAYRLYALAPPLGPFTARAVRVAIVVAFALQPILLVRALPESWREGIIDATIDRGLIKKTDTPRYMYARHFLGLNGDGRRFYYSSRDAIAWLDRNASPKDLVFTNVDDFIMARAKTTGAFLNVISMDVWDSKRDSWVRSLDSVDRIMATRDTTRVLQLARDAGAQYAVMTWPVEDAAYRDKHYSIVRVGRP